MSDVHPSPTAGTGRLKPRRTTYKPGDRVVELRECAQCGFPFREGIDTEGDTQDSPGISIATVAVAVSNNNDKLPQPLKGMAAFLVSSVNVSSPTVGSGCRQCGTLNPRANGRNKDFEYSSKNMENR